MHESMEQNESRRSVVDLLRSLAFEMRDLVRDEVQLAKAEISTNVAQVGSGVTSLAVGALIAFAGFLTVLDASVLLLAKLFDTERLWLAPLTVGVVVMAIGYALLKNAQKRLDPSTLAPRRAVRSLRADATLFKEKVS